MPCQNVYNLVDMYNFDLNFSIKGNRAGIKNKVNHKKIGLVSACITSPCPSNYGFVKIEGIVLKKPRRLNISLFWCKVKTYIKFKLKQIPDREKLKLS